MADFEKLRQLHLQCLELVLKPIVWFAIKRSQSFREFTEVTKKLYVQETEKELKKEHGKVNVSRISVSTGIARNEVKRFLDEGSGYSERPPSVLGRVMGQWEQDPRFKTSKGKPKILSYEGEGSEFQELVRSVSKHHSAGTVLFELERIGAIETTARGIRLIQDVHGVQMDPRDGYQHLSTDIEMLIRAVDRNLETPNQVVKHHHIRTEYDNLYKENLEEIQAWLYREGKAFHKRARDYLSQFDRDVATASIPEGTKEPEAGGRAILTAFSLTMDGDEPL